MTIYGRQAKRAGERLAAAADAERVAAADAERVAAPAERPIPETAGIAGQTG